MSNYNIDLFQLEENVGGTDVQIVSATHKLYRGAKDVSTNLWPTDISDIQETLETEDGLYQIDAVSVTLKGLPATYFQNYGFTAMLTNPFVFLFRENDTTLFHGVVDPEGINYNQKTKLTSVTIFSWDYLLSSVPVPARSIFVTDLAKKYNSRTDGGWMEIYRVVGEWDLWDDNIVQIGDFVKFSGPNGEHRSAVIDVGNIDSEKMKVKIADDAETEIVSGSVDNINVVAFVNDNGTPFALGDLTLIRFQITIVDEAVYSILEALTNRTNTITINESGLDPLTFIFKGEHITFERDGETVIIQPPLVPVSGGLATNGFIPAPYQSWRGNTTATYEIQAEPVVAEATSIEIHGRALYGHYPGSPEAEYEMTDVLDGAFQMDEFGVIKHVFQPIPTPPVHIEGDWYLNKYSDYPPDVVDMISMTTGTTQSWLRLKPSHTAGLLPRITPTLLLRQKVNQTDIPVLAANTVIEWGERVVDLVPSAVVVKPNSPYFKRDGYPDQVGFWTDDIETRDPDRYGLPQGAGVLNVEVNEVPANAPRTAASIFTGGGEPAINDARLSEIAKRIYEFYEAVPGYATGEIKGLRPDLLGNYVSYAEVDGGRTMFVTQQTLSYREGKTSFTGRLGEYIPVLTSTPVAKITGQTVYTDIDGGGTEVVRLSGLQSYDPLETNLSYSWLVDGIERSTTGILEYAMTTGTHAVQLTVTNSQLNSSVASVTVFVIATELVEANLQANDFFQIEKVQVEDSGTQYGELRLYPLIDVEAISKLRARSASGAELAPLDKSSGNVDTWYPDAPLTDTDANSRFYYYFRVALAENHISSIEVFAAMDPSVRATPYTRAFSFDRDRIPAAVFALYISGTDLYLAWDGDEDLAKIKYAVSTTSMPPDVTSGFQMGRESDGINILTMSPGETAYVRARGYNSSDVPTATDFTSALTYPDTSGFYVPTVAPLYDQVGSTGTCALTIVDPGSRVTKTGFATKVGGNDWSSWTYDTVFPFDATETVGLVPKHSSEIRWEVYYDDADSVERKFSGGHSYDLDFDPEGDVELYLTGTGANKSGYARVRGDEDVKSVKVHCSITGYNQSPVIIYNDPGSALPKTYFGSTLRADETLYVVVTFYSQPNQTGDTSEWRGQITNINVDIEIDPDSLPDGSILERMLLESARRFVITSGSFHVDSTWNYIWWNPLQMQIAGRSGTIAFAGGSFTANDSNPRYAAANLDTRQIVFHGNFADSIGSNKILMGVFKRAPQSDQRPFWVPAIGVLGGGLMINADHIAANSISAVHFSAVTLDALFGWFTDLSIQRRLTVSGSGEILIGNTSTGIRMLASGIFGLASGAIQFSINSSTGKITTGGGAEVTLDRNGLTIKSGGSTANKISWTGGPVIFDDTVGGLIIDSPDRIGLQADYVSILGSGQFLVGNMPGIFTNYLGTHKHLSMKQMSGIPNAFDGFGHLFFFNNALWTRLPNGVLKFIV